MARVITLEGLRGRKRSRKGRRCKYGVNKHTKRCLKRPRKR